MKKPPPLPDRNHVPAYAGQELRALIYSADGATRAVITEDMQKRVRVHEEEWSTSGWEHGGTPMWLPAAQNTHIVDSVV